MKRNIAMALAATLAAATLQAQETPAQADTAAIEATYQQRVALRPDGTWAFEGGESQIITDAQGNKYAMFGDGKWAPMETVTDIDGNTYDAIKYGNTLWMTQNLRTTKYANGQKIPKGENRNSQWTSTSGAYANVDNDPQKTPELGLLYSWYAVDNKNGLCPQGWRVPTTDDWNDLLELAGGRKAASPKLKASSGWRDHEGIAQTNGTNEMLFDARPAGWREMHDDKSGFWQVAGEARFWTRENKTATAANTVILNVGPAMQLSPWKKEFGFSVRCVK